MRVSSCAPSPTARAAVAALAERPPHLVIIDWNMPGFAALELIAARARVRAPHPVRLIILSALSGEQDVVTGLNLGADDYIAKPFSVREVVARVCAVLRSRRPQDGDRAALSCDELMLDASTNRVTARGELLNLRGVEYRLARVSDVASRAERSIARNCSRRSGATTATSMSARSTSMCSGCARSSTEPGYEAYIQTVRGFGYRFAPAGRCASETLDHISTVPRDVPRLSSFFVNKSSSPSHAFVTTNRDRSRRREDFRRTGHGGAQRPLAAAIANGLHLGHSSGFQGLQRRLAARFPASRRDGYAVPGRRHHRCVEHAKEACSGRSRTTMCCARSWARPSAAPR